MGGLNEKSLEVDKSHQELSRGLQSVKVDSPLKHLPIFCKDAQAANIYILEAKTPTSTKSESFVFHDAEDFELHLATTPKPQTRIISINSVSSLKPLGILQSSMHTLLDRYEIGSEYLDLVHSFGDKPHISDSGHGGMSVRKRANGAYDMQYLLPYTEDYTSARTGAVSWTDRWVCVFNRYFPEGDGQNLWIFLHAKRTSEAQRRIDAKVSLDADWHQHWHSLHLILLSSYIGNWRWCIRSLGEKLEKLADYVSVSNFSREQNHDTALDWLIELQTLREKLLPFPAKLRVVRQILKKLDEMNSTFHSRKLNSSLDFDEMKDSLEFYSQRVEGHLQSLETLENKTQGTLKLLEVAVDLGSNKKMLKIASHNADDSAAMRVITFLTLIYLPPSFVSTLLGMNLVSFQDGNGKPNFTISKQFWIFIVIWLPLSALTFFSWRIFWKRHLRQRKEEEGTGLLFNKVQ